MKLTKGICSSNFTFADDLLARLKSKFIQRGLQVNTRNYTSISRGSTILEKGVQFFGKMKWIHSESRHNCVQRPDFQLGNFLSNFANYFRGWNEKLKFDQKNPLDSQVHQILFDIIKRSFKTYENFQTSVILPFASNMSKSYFDSCGNLMSLLLKDNFETFLDMMKHSQVGNTTKTLEERNSFVERYFNKNPIFVEATLRTKDFYDHMGMMPFCHFGSMSGLNSITPGVNFINVLHTAFALVDPKSVKRY
jgi:hypothetical protein